MREWISVVELVKAKTLSGGLVVRCTSSLPFLLSEGMEVAFVPPLHDLPRRSTVKTIQDEGKGSYLVSFEDVDDINTAEMLVGCRCLIRRSEVDESLFANPLNDVLGFAVRDKRFGDIGTVVDIIENPGQSLLEVATESNGCRVLIPFVDAFVLEINEDAHCISTSLPDGLLGL